MITLMAAVEIAGHIPALAWLDSCQPEHLLMQFPILMAGMLCYGSLLTLAYRISVKRFEKVDL